MWWVVIIAIVTWILIKFFSDWNSESGRVASEGGMRKKYSALVDWALSWQPNCKIIQEDKTFIRVGVSSAGDSTFFDIYQTFGKELFNGFLKALP